MHLKIEADFKVLGEIKSKLKQLSNSHSEWGWINEKSYPSNDVAGRSGIKIAEIARINEYGGVSKGNKGFHTRIPPRPYFRQALMATESRLLADAKAIITDVLNNKPHYQALERQARLASLDIILSVRKQNQVRLAKQTIDIKGHSVQWTDTGVMLSNIGFRVYKTSSSKAKGGDR